MSISRFFMDLRSAYQAELDDLRFDSEGKDVLRKRLAEKRKELDFLLQMMEAAPEMVAVVLQQAFRFKSTPTMDHLVAQDSDDLPEWDSISDSIEIAAWAEDMVKAILKEPMGAWFMTVAAALEYLQNRPLTAAERAQFSAEDEEEEEDGDTAREQRHDDNHTEDHEEDEADARAREEAGNDWMVEQGFDRKE